MRTRKTPHPSHVNNPTKWCGCVVCETWVHEECVAPVVNPFICRTCCNLGARALEGDIKWDDATDKLRQIVKAIFIDYGKGVGGDLRAWAAHVGVHVEEMSREIGERFWGSFFAGASIYAMRKTLVDFIATQESEKSAWVRGLINWLQTEGGEIFLALCAVVHASFVKVFWNTLTAKGGSMSVVDAYPYVHKITDTLYRYGENPELALQCEGRAMDLAHSSPVLVELKCRLRIVFKRMHRRWLHYTFSYRSGGSTCVPEMTPEQKKNWEVTPCDTIFCELFFGTLGDTLHLGGTRINPQRAAFTAIHRHNHKFDRPLEEDEVSWISKTARVVEARYGSQKEMRGQQYRDKMLAARQDAVQQAPKKLAAAKRALQKEEARVATDPQRQAERGGGRVRASNARQPKPNPRYMSQQFC